MNLSVLLVFCFVKLVLSDESEEYLDTLLHLLMDGDVVEYDPLVEDEMEPTLFGDQWRCGDCAGVDASRPAYSETTVVDAGADDAPLDIQVGVSVPSMRCVTVEARGSVVRRVRGACSGGAVTLAVAPAQRVVVNAYT